MKNRLNLSFTNTIGMIFNSVAYVELLMETESHPIKLQNVLNHFVSKSRTLNVSQVIPGS